ncbi:DMT family transporter [Bdellovibrio sp. 22V]|uniref:DMT family transporter n=1 Tax=Bdellovibrio sp. 22V TaxID=3044166 RepID=UPI002542918B|nr:DMT family transporter [Bdellovibrio sp. 22V]WII73298.1 DMT family transporter [Bdellovibrio sp. 22V]
MVIKFFLPIVAGLSIVLQGTLNRNSATQIGLVSAILLNAGILLVLAGALWLLMKFQIISGTPALSAKPFMDLRWWQLLPGLCGFLIVFATPMAIENFGANLTFSVIICTQLLVSLFWDSYAQKTPPSWMSLVGVAVMCVGLFILMSSKK